ncbi:unnamed protein product [Ectocarpus sp. CCAP 1310/34]|nr:unnamed protein product [Ectocarpus sp. CCAP 1310/34]
MRLNRCLVTGVYMAAQSFFSRGASFRGLGSGSCSNGLRAGRLAGRVNHRHRHLHVLANPTATSADTRISSNMMIGSSRPPASAADPRCPIHELATSSSSGEGGGSGRRRSKSHRRRRSRSEDEKDRRQAGKAGGDGSPPRGGRLGSHGAHRAPGAPGRVKKRESAGEDGDGRRRRRGGGPAAKKKKDGADDNRLDRSSSSRRSRSPKKQQQGGGGGVPQLPLFGLDIPEDRVHVVDTPEGVRDAAAVLGRSVLMSVDTETQPSFAVGEWHPTSLLQVATRDANGEEDVLVIDLLSLKDGLFLPESLSEALSGPFGSPSVVKLGGPLHVGVGLANDLDEMSFAFDKTPFLEQVPGVLNLNALNTKLTGGVCDDQGIPRDLGLRKLASM